ncbi:MAG TPA: hypothetical protein VHI71_06735 [Actinomycetota bacterium]|nr:hypothetical protein [Actinomycetota bacterium]
MTFLERLRSQHGVAMITVLFVGATLTVLTTTAALMSVRGLQSTSADARSARAMAAAEAGLERFMLDVKRGAIQVATMKDAGCASAPIALPSGTLGPGTYDVQLTIYEPTQAKKVPPSPWTAANVSVPPCTSRLSPNLYAVTATGKQGSGTRVVRQVIRAIPGKSKFPLGIYADRIDANGNPDMNNISIFTRGDIVGRGKMSLSGIDANYTMRDVYDQSAFGGFSWSGGLTWDSNIPAAVHATGEIYAKGAAVRGREHPPAPNCNANDTRNGGYALQSEWDGSACSGCANNGVITSDVCSGPITSGTSATGYPPTAKFTQADLDRIAQVRNFTEDEYATLRASAQASGVYCNFASGVNQCWKNGVAGPPDQSWQDGDLPTSSSTLIAYFDFPASTNITANTITWTATWKALSGVMCNAANPADNRVVVAVVRNGNFLFGGNAQVTGAFLAPEGDFDSTGTPVLHGSVTARTFRVRGNATFESSSCFAAQLPTTSSELTVEGWSEIDR